MNNTFVLIWFVAKKKPTDCFSYHNTVGNLNRLYLQSVYA